MICRSNYELYLIDYLDNNLTPAVRAEVEAFLMANPDLAAELDGMSEICASAPRVCYKGKEGLKKMCPGGAGVENELDYLCIAELEGDINTIEHNRLEQLTSTKVEVKKLRGTYSRTKLMPDTSITFEPKQQLKHRSLTIFKRMLYSTAAAAAMVGLIFGSYRFYTASTNSVKNVVVAASTGTETLGDNIDIVEDNDINPEIATPVAGDMEQNAAINTHKTSAIEYTTESFTRGRSIVNADIKPIKPIEARIEFAHNGIIGQAPVGIIQQPIRVSQYVAEAHYPAQQAQSRTKEYSIKDIAIGGAQKIGEFLGIKSNVAYSNSGKVTRVKIEGNLIAFSSTYKRNEEK